MPRGVRRDPRVNNMLRKKVKYKTYISSITTLSIIIVLCMTIIGIRTYHDRMEAIKQEEERTQKLREIFVAQEEQAKQDIKGAVETNANIMLTEEEEMQDTSIRMVCVGDILCEEPLYNDAYQNDTGEFNFVPMFENIYKYSEKADLTIGTMETNFIDETISGYRKYNSPKELGNALKLAGVDVLSTATNHSFDYGYEGIKATKDYFDLLEIDTVGTRRKEEKNQIVIKDIKGIKIAFLAYTYGLNNEKEIQQEDKNYVNLIEKKAILRDIQTAKENQVDYICVQMHWGDLTSTKQNEEQEELTQLLLDNGVDLILGSHPAVIQPMQIRKNSDGEDAFVAYSVGNYISASEYENSNIEMILEVQVTKNAKTGKVYLSKVTYTPVYLLDNGSKAEDRYQLYDIKDVIKKYESGSTEVVTKEIYEKLKQALMDIEKLIGRE